ncbi:2-hydroxychromene-2-carboxylate isomerase [Motiliproteus sp.]|uniref:2-hydroxychromene-2-carboxylate isomerase n=1 Tax=Motiliproteus sp. TaxID=1898955 RepID=UPI003BA9360A
MSRTIEFFYDLMSPYSHLANWRLPGVAKRSAAVVVPRPVSLPELLALSGNQHPAELETKRDYMRRDLDALGRYYGIPMEWPEQWPVDSSRAMAALALLEGRAQQELANELFSAIWDRGEDIADPESLVALLGESLWQQSDTDEARQRLRDNTREAFERGAFGVPSCFAGEQLFFGNERLFLLQMHLNG